MFFAKENSAVTKNGRRVYMIYDYLMQVKGKKIKSISAFKAYASKKEMTIKGGHTRKGSGRLKAAYIEQLKREEIQYSFFLVKR